MEAEQSSEANATPMEIRTSSPGAETGFYSRPLHYQGCERGYQRQA